MKISDLRDLLKNKEVIEEINRHLWIESQKAGYSIGIERATDEWLTLYAEGWMKYHMPEKHKTIQARKKKEAEKKKRAKSTPKKKVAKKAVEKTVTKKKAVVKKAASKKKAVKK